MRHREHSASENYFWPAVWAVALHVLIFGMLFVSFAMTPELPPARPIVQATLYQLKSKSQATTQTNQKLAGEAKKSAARQTEVEQMETKKVEQEEIKAAEQKKADAAQKAEAAAKADEAKKADAAAKAADAAKTADAAKAAEAKKAEQADIAKKKAEEEAKKEAAEEAKKQAADDAKKKAAADAAKAAEDAKKKAADDAKAKAAADAKAKATEDAKKKAAADAAKKKAQDAARKAAEDKKAQALADLLSDTPQRQQALADEQGDEVAGNFDDLVRSRAAEGWARPPSARKGMTVVLQINMLPDGTVTNVSVAKSSGDGPFDSSAVAAVKNIGRLTEMQGLKPADFNPYRSFKMTFTPEDLAL